jgi:hypothetical protein
VTLSPVFLQAFQEEVEKIANVGGEILESATGVARRAARRSKILDMRKTLGSQLVQGAPPPAAHAPLPPDMMPVPLTQRPTPVATGSIGATQYHNLRGSLQGGMAQAPAAPVGQTGMRPMPLAGQAPISEAGPRAVTQTMAASVPPGAVPEAPNRWAHVQGRLRKGQDAAKKWWEGLSPEDRGRYMMAGVGAGSLGVGFAAGEAGHG